MTTETSDPIPRNYDEWRHCIEHWCGIELKPEFIAKRLSALQNASDEHTQRLRACYGEDHLQSLIGWFKRAENEQQT